MNYTNHYNKLIIRAKSRNLNGYKEKHHVIPKCIGGSDKKSNLVELTAEEHYLAHQLLLKMFPDNIKLVYAAIMMSCGSKNTDRSNNKIYGWLKRKYSLIISEAQSGVGNSQYGTCWISNLETKECIKIKTEILSTYLEAGWIKKRIINWGIVFRQCVFCKKDFKNLLRYEVSYCSDKCREDAKKKKTAEKKVLNKKSIIALKETKYDELLKKELIFYKELYERHKKGESLRTLAKDCSISHVTLFHKFKKY